VSRTQDCLAVSGDGVAWYLLNASPDLGRQLAATPELSPPSGTRDTPVRGVLLTSGELDHTLGLLALREAASLDVYAPDAVLDTLPFRPTLAPYTAINWHAAPLPPATGPDASLTPDKAVAGPGGGRDALLTPDRGTLRLAGGLEVRAIPLGSKRPRYVSGGVDGVRVVGYRVTDGRGTLVYAPGIRVWEPALCDGDLVFLDGTFATGDEMPGIAGHLPISESVALLPVGPRYRYTHVNNTNPANRPDWPGHAALAAVGAAIATDGEMFSLDG
jgi:pyrroloquinoline quinone biosynthesis protein B